MIGSSGPCPTSLAPKGPRGSGSSMSSVSTSGMSSEVGLLYSSMEGNLCTSAWESRFGSQGRDRKSTRLNSSHGYISYAVFCLKKKKNNSYKVCTAGVHYILSLLMTLFSTPSSSRTFHYFDLPLIYCDRPSIRLHSSTSQLSCA